MLSTKEYKIPSNNTNFFIIQKSDWANSIDIIIKDGFNFNIVNLYFIIKSYFNSKNFINAIYIATNTKEKDLYTLFTYKKVEKYSLEKMSIFDFIKWLKNNLESDKEYLMSSNFYGFKIVFYEFSINIENNEIYPIYPWIDPYFISIKNMKDLNFIDV
jgi:hypothetical protein